MRELVLALAILAALVAATWLLARAVRRYVRRRWRRWLATAGGGLAGALVQSARWSSLTSLFDPRWWAVQRERRRMWQAVTAASHTVEQAEAAGAPVGDLPRLCVELRGAAAELDRLLSATGTSGPGAGATAAERQARRDLQGLLQAAGDVHTAGLVALGHRASPQVADVVSSVRLETAALHSGLTAARSHTVDLKA